MNSWLESLVLILAVGLLSACATPSVNVPPELQYVAPDRSQDTATLVGSQQDVPLLDDFTAWVTVIDGKRVMQARPGWKTPLTISAGPHRIGATFQRGAWSAHAALRVDAVAGASYQLRFSSDLQTFHSSTYCEFWIVDTVTGKPVTDLVRVGLMNSDWGGVAVPIFIPRR